MPNLYIIEEIQNRLHFLQDVGLEYLTLSRAAGTLSGGESQRIRLATQIGSGLTGVLYILDEPSIGLHQPIHVRASTGKWKESSCSIRLSMLIKLRLEGRQDPIRQGKSIADVLDMTALEASAFFENLPKIRKKVDALCRVGLGYMKLGQASTTLSGGEAQRVKLATELLKPATGSTLYIMDEPTTGLHVADVHQLIHILHDLVDGGNTVVVIEHNLDLIKNADHIIDLGPEGGPNGGTIICSGTPEEVAACSESYTGRYLDLDGLK